MKFKDIYEAARGRDIYIYGAGCYGCAVWSKLSREGIKVKGFIENCYHLYEGASIQNHGIYPHGSLADINPKPFVVIASHYRSRDVAKACLAAGLGQNQDFCIPDYPVHYWIEVAGVCNLKCPSCPQGNYPSSQPPTGMMSFEKFEKIIDKMQRDTPDVFEVSLFNWGEPFLNPDLDKMIKLLKDRGIFSILSSNFSLSKNIDKPILANPDWLKISLSGYYPDAYNSTHTGGDINLVKSNLYRLRFLIDQYKLDTIVEVDYHQYTNNIGEDKLKMIQLCQELNFNVRLTTAFLSPREKTVELIKQKGENPHPILDLMLAKPNFNIEFNENNLNGECVVLHNQMIINCDGTVAICCTAYDRENMVECQFDETPYAEIIKQKAGKPLCYKCKGYGLYPRL